MRRGSIVLKLFIITALCFSLFISVFIVGQTLFFKKFYLNSKISKLEKSIEAFGDAYEEENWGSTDILQKVNIFTDQNNAQIAVLDGEGNAKYTPTFQIIIQTEENNEVKVPLNNIAYLDGFQSLELAVGADIEVEGFFSDDFSQTLSLSGIKKGDRSWENTNAKLVKANASIKATNIIESAIGKGKILDIKDEKNVAVTGSITAVKPIYGIRKMVGIEFKKIKGKITELIIPTKIEQMANYNNVLLWSSIDYWNQLIMLDKIKMNPGETATFHYTSPSNGIDNIAFVRPVLKNNIIYGYVFVISSLQPVGEAVDAMKDYYLYAFLIAILLIAVMSLIYSRSISHPLIKMNRVAAKMANLDFSEECEIKSKDELGNLAVSLNYLSKNLGESLKELKTANEQLQLDIEKERNLEKMRKEFVSSVSHEFKTPLGIIKGFAEGFKDNVAEDKKEYYIDVILDEIEKMDELVLDLLDLAKLESKAYVLNMEKFKVIDLIDEVDNRLLKGLKEKNINLGFDYESNEIEVYGDRRRIEQVIANILNNAMRHTPNNGYIKINTEKKENELYVNVENSGEHINDEDLTRIWDRFYRTEKSRARKTGGTGLGLSIVKNILEMHESRFGAENTEDGVRFYFTLKCDTH